jgi:DsbC/DsbD-like thiol-disulfide interchange protein
MHPVVASLCVLLACTMPAGTASAEAVVADHLEVELLSENSALVPGRVVWLGLRLKHAPQWHTYWINPGDSGLPTKLTWTLPPGYKAGEIVWPVPQRFQVGDLYNFGYDGNMMLPVPITVPTDAAIGATAQLGVEARWLVCHEECIPGKASLHIELPVAAAAKADSRVAALFAAAHAAVPPDSEQTATAQMAGDRIEVAINGVDPHHPPTDAFARQTKIVANAPPKIDWRDGKLVLTFARSDYFTAAPGRFELLLINNPAHSSMIQPSFTPMSSPPPSTP